MQNKQIQNKQNTIRPDFIFSYWIFLWFLLYELKLVSYNPKNAISVGIVTNIFMLLFLINKKAKMYNIIKFIVINSIIKIIPFILISKTNVTNSDNYFFIFLVILYLSWIYFNDKMKKQTINQTYDDLLIAYLNDGKNKRKNNRKTTLSHYYDIIFNKLNNIFLGIN